MPQAVSEESQNELHVRWMSRALEVAREAGGRGEVPVGAVLVDSDGREVASAGNEVEARKDGTAHAELIVLQQGSARIGEWRLTGCTLYVTKEPCAMCAGAVLSARIPRVVYGASDQKFGACKSVCSLFDMNFNHHPQVVSGVMEEESAALLRSFFQNLRVELRSRPKWRKPGESF